MFPFQSENQEMKFAKEQNADQMQHTEKLETLKTLAQDDQTVIQRDVERTDLLKWQQDLEPELQRLINVLKGNVLMNNEWTPRTYWKDGKLLRARAMCNDRFIQEVIIPQCSPFLDRNLLNTYYEEKDILKNLMNTCDDIADAMADHYDDYGIEFTDYDIVLRNIKNVIRPGIYRALKGFTKKIDSTIIRRVEQSNEMNQDREKKGMMSIFPSINKR
jgi:hypothetical protein